MGKSASILGLLGLVSLAFALIALLVFAFGFSVPATEAIGRDPFVTLNLVAGLILVVAALAFGWEGFRRFLSERSTRYGAEAFVYSVLFLGLVVLANVMAVRHPKSWDLTEAGVSSLAPQTVKQLDALKEDLTMTAFVDGGVSPTLDSLLDRYRSASSHVKVRTVDPEREPNLTTDMKITSVPSVHLQYGKESFVVSNVGRNPEEEITNGVIRVARGTKKIVYFTEGDGEATIEDKEEHGYSEAKTGLEQENYDVKTLLLPTVDEVPGDANAVVLAGPSRPLHEQSIATIQRYLARGGHLLALCGPRDNDPGLAKLLADWGVKLGNDIVVDRQFAVLGRPLEVLSAAYEKHPITQNFRDFTLYPQSRTVEPDAAGKKGLQVMSLAKTSPASWAETNVDEVFTKGTAQLDEADRKGPLSLAVAVVANLKVMGIEPAAGDEKKADEARLVVFGTPMFADNRRFLQLPLNGDLFLNAIGWLVGQEESVSIRLRTVRASKAELSNTQVRQLFYLSILIIPELLIAVGIGVWWVRRSG